MNCNILRPRNDICRVVIPEMNEPFRIGIRAFRLQDESVGSFAMISDIEYHADVCLETSKLTFGFFIRLVRSFVLRYSSANRDADFWRTSVLQKARCPPSLKLLSCLLGILYKVFDRCFSSKQHRQWEKLTRWLKRYLSEPVWCPNSCLK